jgi:MFS family permease
MKKSSVRELLVPKVKSSRGTFDLKFVKYNTYFGIKMKPLFERKHLMAIPLITFCGTIVGCFVNTQMVFILRDKEYFDVPVEKLGRTSNDLIFYSVLVPLFLSFIIGYLYDICGRVYTIFISSFISGSLVFCIPVASPHLVPWLFIIRIGIGCTFVVPNSHPLINDCVQRGSRGRAIAF